MPSPPLCPRCGIGFDDDGDGNCSVCAKISDAELSLRNSILTKEKPGKRISRHKMMFMIALTIAKRGTCNRAKVGCVVCRDGRVLVTGYNGSLPGEPHCEDVGCLIENGHCIRTTHAEANAIAFAAKHGIALDGATIYVVGWKGGVCPTCLKLVKSAGIEVILTEESGTIL